MVRFMLKNGADPTVKNQLGQTPADIAAITGNVEVVDAINKALLERGLPPHTGPVAQRVAAKEVAPLNLEDRFHALEAQIVVDGLAGKLTPLHAAVQDKDGGDLVDYIVAHHREMLDTGDVNGLTPLHGVVMLNNAAFVQKLIAAGANPNARASSGETPLHLAASYADPRIVNALVLAKADVNAADAKGRSPLHQAVDGGTEMVATLLIVNGASLRVADACGNTPLHLACAEGAASAPTVELMLQKCKAQAAAGSASPADVQNADGDLPIHAAARYATAAVVAVVAAQTLRPNLNRYDKSGNAPLHIAVIRNDADVAQALIRAGADPNLKNAANSTPLQLAVERDAVEVVRMLVSAVEGLDIEMKTDDGWTPLYTACWRGNVETVQALMRCKANPNTQNKLGWSPLHAAAHRGHIECARLLLAGGVADANIQDNQGTTALYHACDRGRDDVALDLIAAPGIDVHLSARRGWKPIHAICRRGRLDVLRALLRKNSDPLALNAPVDECQAYAPLHVAVMSSRNSTPDILQALISAGADPNQQTASGQTPLHLACCTNNQVFVHYFVESVAINMKAKNKNGRTALDLCCYYGLEELVKFLVEKTGKKKVPKLEHHQLMQEKMDTYEPDAPPPPEQF
eukprot:TRINITY_DN880_c0_g1_i1.p1 TRINITY_DN880_c0_g1~~TRINITY_DN880_c0_g1_i1.p1  ORF type:complete len:633 (-),score=165.96 TRINITY_DN880_c0_g1_i1:91-1989(-)